MLADLVKTRLSKLSSLPLLSRLSPSSSKQATEEELELFRVAQRLSYDAAIETAQALRLGWSERRTASWMEEYLNDHGVRSYFHQPLAWFGDRARFKGFRSGNDALPSDRRLENPEEVVVLDVAPIVNGVVGDIGFGFSLAPNELLVKARAFLVELRNELPALFASDMTSAEIWQQVDKRVKEAGYENCHRKYQFSVLGHRVHHVPLSHMRSTAGVYSLHGYWALASRGLFPELLSPWHEGERIGLWAIEPHLGVEKKFGVKFEEILVVEKDRAYWIDDDVPHVNLPAGLY